MHGGTAERAPHRTAGYVAWKRAKRLGCLRARVAGSSARHTKLSGGGECRCIHEHPGLMPLPPNGKRKIPHPPSYVVITPERMGWQRRWKTAEETTKNQEDTRKWAARALPSAS
jgi:hypothetical protein